MKRNIHICLLLWGLVFCSASSAQNSQNKQELYNISVPTPQAAALGEYGKVPVDLFSGKANVSIPLFQFPAKGIELGVSLSYNGGGIKPNDKGGWTGLGWSLVTTGTITRVQNGMTDEHRNTFYTDPNMGYYWNRTILNRPDWNTSSGVDNLLMRLQCGGWSVGNCAGVGQIYDWAPDEFVFNIPGYSGSFWLDHLGNWVVRENNGEKLKITETVGSYTYRYPQIPGLPAPGPVNLANMFTGFTIKDGYGNKFLIGFDDNNIEFNRNTPVNGTSFVPATATTWYLKQIITKQGEIINYTYERKWPAAGMFSSMSCYGVVAGQDAAANSNLNELSGMLQDPVHLKQISFNDLTLDFIYSENDINNVWSADIKNKTSLYNLIDITHWATLPSNEIEPVFPKDFKLDRINITQNNSTKQLRFNYYTSAEANRLFLKSVQIGNISSPLLHEFDYYGKRFTVGHSIMNLIYDGAVTTKIDHCGFYTGKLPFPTSELPLSNGTASGTFMPSNGFLSAYYANREPIFDSAIIGSLKSVKYPTRGTTEFIYELHTYSSKLDDYNNSVNLNTNSIAGGLRIKEVKSYSGLADDPQVKTYNYSSTNGISSGILNSSGVRYSDEQTGTTIAGPYGSLTVSFKYFYDNNQYPLQGSGGSSVNYSRVEEVSEDGGKTVSEFTNHDNGYRDIMPFTYSSGLTNSLYNKQSSSRAFTRGKLLNVTTRNASVQNLTKEINTYEDDAAAISNQVGVRSYNLKPKDIRLTVHHGYSGGILNNYFGYGAIFLPAVSSFLYYTYPHNIGQKEQITYDNTNTINTKELYTYNPFNNKIKTKQITNLSQGLNKTSTLFYPNELTAGNPFYTGMVNDFVINPAVKTVTNNSAGTHLGTQEDLLQLFNINQNVYLLNQRESYRNPSLKDKVTISRYDNHGNPETMIGNSGIPISYKWGVKVKQPVLKVINAGFVNGNPQFFYEGFEENGVYQNFNGYAGDGSFTGDYITSFVKPDARSYYIDYRYLSGGKWFYIKKTYTQGMVLNEGDNIDEVRIYSTDALVASYTYRQLYGMTSESGSNNQSVHYEYDNLQRLNLIRDQDKNVIKKICYNYSGQPETCPVSGPIYNNVAASGAFTRNNCPAGYTGSTVTYTVPAGTYISTISQLDADQQAQNDVNANGQAYANANGTCTPPAPGGNITLLNAFSQGFPSAVKLEFLQGGVVMNTHFFPATNNVSTNVSVPAGTYNLRFTMTTGYTGYYVEFIKQSSAELWNNNPRFFSVINTGPTTFNSGTNYTITGGN